MTLRSFEFERGQQMVVMRSPIEAEWDAFRYCMFKSAVTYPLAVGVASERRG